MSLWISKLTIRPQRTVQLLKITIEYTQLFLSKMNQCLNWKKKINGQQIKDFEIQDPEL